MTHNNVIGNLDGLRKRKIVAWYDDRLHREICKRRKKRNEKCLYIHNIGVEFERWQIDGARSWKHKELFSKENEGVSSKSRLTIRRQ